MKFFSANKFIISALLLCISASLFVFVISLRQTEKVKSTSTEVIHANTIISSLDEIIIASFNLQSETRGYLITGDSKLIQHIKTIPQVFKSANERIIKSISDTHDYGNLLDNLQQNIQKALAFSDSIILLKQQSKELLASAKIASGSGNTYIENINASCFAIKLTEFNTKNIITIKNENAIYKLNNILYTGLLIVVLLGLFLYTKVKTEFNAHRTGEEKLKSILESAPDATIITNKAGQIKLVNLQTEKLTGYSKAELLGSELPRLVSPHLRKKHASFFNNLSAAKSADDSSIPSEMEILCKNAEKVPVEITLSPISFNGEKFIYVSLRNISVRKEEQREIRTLFTQINQANEAIYIVDDDLTIRSWNKGAENLYGFTKEEAIGKNSITLLQTALTIEQLDEANTAIGNVGAWSGELKRKNKKGEDIHVYSSFSVTQNDGDDVKKSIVSVSFDITPLKKLEEQVKHLASIVEQSSEAIISSDINQKIVSWNRGAEKMLGHLKNEVIGKNILELEICKLTDEEILELMRGIEENGSVGFEKEYYHKNGQVITGAVSANTIKNENGTITGIVFIIKDVTLRKQLEIQLKKHNDQLEEKVKQRTEDIRKSEEKYKLLYNNNPLPMWVFDIETFKILDVNKAAEIIYGYSREEFLKLTLLDIRPEEDKKTFLAVDHSHNRTENKLYRGIWRHLKKDNTQIQVEIFNHPLIYEGAKARLTLLNDVTERLASETKLAASEKRFRALIENNYDIITMLDKDFNVVYRSPSTKRITGYPDDEIIGFNGLKNVHPDDIPTAKEGIAKLFSMPGSVEERQFRIKHKNGNYLWMEGNAVNLLHDENIKAIVLNYRDVTERILAETKLKASEKRFRALIENSYDIITMMDKDFKVIYRSPSAVRITGRGNEDVIGIDARIRIHPEDLPDIAAGIKRLLATPGTTENTVFRYQHKNGSYLWMEGNATNLLHEENVNAIVFNYKDVSDKVIAQEKLIASEERYRSALDNMMEGVQIIGFDWKYKYLNNASTKQGKYKKEDLIGFTVMEKYPGIEQTELYRKMQECFANRIPVMLENKFTYPDGSVAWFELSIQPVQEGIFILSVEVTEKVLAAAALQEEKDKLVSIAATSPGLIYSFRMSTDGTFSFPFLSSAAEDIFGMPIIAFDDNLSALMKVVVPDDMKNLKESIIKSAESMLPWQLEFKYRHPQKGLRWLEGNSLPTKENDGSILWHGILMDITDRKKAEERLIEKNAQLETLSNNLHGVMIYQLIADDYNSRKFNYVSKEVTRLTGKSPDEVIKDPTILYNTILETDQKRFTDAEINSISKKIAFNEEVRCYNFKGEIRWLNIISTPRKTIEGNFVWDGFHVDITERKKNEASIRENYIEKRMLAEKLSTILNTLPANIALLDENGIIVDVNQSWIAFPLTKKWYGNNYGLGQSYITLTENSSLFNYDFLDKQTIAAGIKNVLNRSTDKFIYECHTQNKKYWLRKIISPLSGEGYTGAVVMHIDISQLHKLEEERIKIKTEEQKNITAAILQGQEKERNAIGKELHDNINQILAGINMLLGVISKKPEKMNELLPLCIENLNLAVKENRKIAHELVSPYENAENLVEQVKNVAKNMLNSVGINTRVEYQHYTEALLTNEQRLAIYRIVQEQCNNIIKYAVAKKVVFLLHTSASVFLLIIKDDGKGMDANKRVMGIGIQNIRSRVSVFNGLVNITTKPGRGFMLCVEIPLSK